MKKKELQKLRKISRFKNFKYAFLYIVIHIINVIIYIGIHNFYTSVLYYFKAYIVKCVIVTYYMTMYVQFFYIYAALYV